MRALLSLELLFFLCKYRRPPCSPPLLLNLMQGTTVVPAFHTDGRVHAQHTFTPKFKRIS